MRTHVSLAFACLVGTCAARTGPSSALGPAPEGQLLFDGRSLAGWRAPDMSYFSVQDGAITGETTESHSPPQNQFIVWQGGEVEDFELTFEFRMFGAAPNSGMQFRSRVDERGLVHGYQADITPFAVGAFLGGIYDEYGPRKSLAARGQKVIIAEDGTKTVEPFADPAALLAGIDLGRWNEYRIRAQGTHLTLFINGERTAELEDREQGRAARRGVLAMPIIPGKPMKVQYRALRLRRL